MNLFKDTSHAMETCAENWDMSGPFPVPKQELICPICRTPTMTLRGPHFHLRPDSPRLYRCKISFKCVSCSYVNTYGVVIGEAMYKAAEKRDKLHMTWREAKEVLENGWNGKSIV